MHRPAAAGADADDADTAQCRAGGRGFPAARTRTKPPMMDHRQEVHCTLAEITDPQADPDRRAGRRVQAVPEPAGWAMAQAKGSDVVVGRHAAPGTEGF